MKRYENHFIIVALIFFFIATIGVSFVSATPTKSSQKMASTGLSALNAEVQIGTVYANQDGFATLNINSKVPLKIFIDGAFIGSTPIKGLRVSAGKHRVEMVNKNKGIRKVKSIKVRSGETKTIRYP